jgi:hypothetical protein
MDRRPAAPHFVAVDDVVMDEEGGLDELDGRHGPDRGPARAAPDPGTDRDHAAAEHLAGLGERPELAQGVLAPGVDPGVRFPLVPEELVQISDDLKPVPLETVRGSVRHATGLSFRESRSATIGR